ncbi:MAG: hypothetical protein RLN88_15080 [Ekhidna sp.]|uniref:hypothetical protein n=1 Tax=Ekhidna sp. TaxID=2608089 RepID=UPI0032EE94E6
MKLFHLRQFALIIIFILIACREDSMESPDDGIDHDMIAATDLAEEYLQSKGGRFGKSDKAITVLKYKDGALLFDTNTDDHEGYQVVEETSITANVDPGDYIFWFAGGGLSEVDEIDFDGEAQEILGTLPVDFVPQKMWIIRVPSDLDQPSMLKYDIVYVPRETGIQIRLDPKISVGGQSDTETSD